MPFHPPLRAWMAPWPAKAPRWSPPFLGACLRGCWGPYWGPRCSCSSRCCGPGWSTGRFWWRRVWWAGARGQRPGDADGALMLPPRWPGVVAAMPQTNEAGTRIRVDVEAARLNGAPVTLPPRIDVAWYGGPFRDAAGTLDLQRPPPALKAGDRWALTVRLKAPHGLRNPHGFDYELWMWEQGVQATGYVRAGPKDEPPEFVAASWRHPVERARQSVRDAILERLAGDQDGSDPARTRVAGVDAL